MAEPESIRSLWNIVTPAMSMWQTFDAQKKKKIRSDVKVKGDGSEWYLLKLLYLFLVPSP
ncbi:hypothetical protein ACFL2V_17920 [Pseudomonadota bacterium]